MMVRKRKKRNKLWDWIISPFVRTRRGENQPDYVLLATVGLLLFFGFLFLSSASSTLGFYQRGDTYFFVKQQITHGLLPGILFFYIAFRINYNIYNKLSLFALLGSFLLLILVFISSLQSGYGTAQSWIILGGVSFQPSELVKLLLILFLAGWFSRKGKSIKDLKSTTIPFVIIMSLISFLIIKQPDFGTLSIIGLTAMSMYYIAGAKLSHIAYIVSAAVLAFIAMVKAAPYRMSRFISWFNPDVDPRGIGWQVKQSLIAVGSGGWFGTGLGASRQKSYLPMPANDSIFAVIAEELGFVFTVCILALFAILMYRGFQIAKNSQDNFAKLAALGITVWISLQVFINIAGVIKLLPLTGVPLPLVSLGGSNMVVTLIAVGVLANISKFTNK